MKTRSRLTALLLALVMALGTAAPALATTIDLAMYQQLVNDAQVEPVIDEGGEVYDFGGTAEEAASGYDVTSEVTLAVGDGEQDVALPVNGKLLLTSAIENGQWQVQVGDMWVNMHGETGSTLEVTYAKVQSLFVMNNAAKLRFISADGSAVSNVANVGLDYSVQTLEEDVAMPMMFAARRSVGGNAGISLAAEGDEEETPTTVMIEIAYEFANGEPAANSYTATIGYNTDLTTSVIQLPKVVGYLPTCAHSQTEGVVFDYPDPATNFNGTIQLSLKKVTTNLKFTVVYEPTFVDFKVEHYLMGFDAKQETAVHQEDADQIITGKKTGDPVGEGLAKTTYSGYRALWYDDTTEIAADGSTVIKVYYERNWYLMLFDLDGGYGVEPIYAQYGAPIQIGTPTKPGYSFLGWAATSTGDVDATLPPATMPCCDSTDGKVTYYAKWDANDTATVTVVFWGETPNCPENNKEYDYLGSGTLSANVGESFTYNNENTTFQICGQEEHTHDENCLLDCGKEEHEAHTIADGCYTLTCTQVYHNHNQSNCTLECTHTHTVDCYYSIGRELREVAKPSEITTTPTSDGVVTYKTGNNNNTTHYYLYLNGKWYCAYEYNWRSGSWEVSDTGSINLYCRHSHTDECYTCGLTANNHSHSIANGCYQLTCNKEIHVHSDLCRSCGMIAHTHTDECWQTGSGLDANLWTLVATETVTVAPDGTSIVNVKYDRTEFTLTFHYNYSNGYQSTSTIRDKWGADIGERFLAVNEAAKGNLWSESTNGGQPWTSYLQIMPQANVDYYCISRSTNSQTAEYYTETLNDGEYELEYSVTAYYDRNLTISKEDFYPMEGYTYSHGTDGSGNAMEAPGSYGRFNGAKFYYTRNSYVLDFNNGYSIVKSENVKYEAPLETYETYVPDAPSIYEEDSVRFAGWYLNPQCTGEEYDLTSHKMPAANLILYAKWEPVVHDVTVYIHLEDVGVKDPLIVTFRVTHNEFVPEGTFPSKAEMEEKVGLTFIGWFYERTNEDGTVSEVAFDPDNMPVKNDMNVYAKWSYNDPITFTVYYRLADENGNAIQAKDENGNLLFDENKEPVYIEVAEPLHSKAMYGTTITVAAKTGDELYKDYRKGYFPHPPSHSVELEIREDGKENEYVFLYTYAESVPYLVKYIKVDADGNPVLDADGNAIEVADEKYVAKNADTVVTENYVRVPGYMPDEYQKRLIVMYGGTTEDDGDYVSEADKGENIIYFYYKEDRINAFWTVTHYIEPVGGVTDEKPWQQFGLPLSQSGVINEYQTASPLDIEGFTYTAELTEVDLYQKDGSKETVVPAELEQLLPGGGMDYRLYYKRNKYPVKVQYMIDGTTTQLADPELVTEADGTTVSTFEYQSSMQVSTDKTFEGYKLVSANPQTLYSVAVDGTTLDTIQYNILTFYYAEKESTFNYVVVGPDGCGTVDLIDTDDEPAISTSETVTMLTGTPVGATAVSTNTDYFVFEGWYSDAACTKENLLTTKASYVPTKAEGQELWPETSTFYAKFVEQPVTITYKVVGPDGCGTVDLNDQDAATVAGTTVNETIANRVSGTALGATAAPSSNVYKFVGWYTDAACNTPVVAADGTVTDTSFVPVKEAANTETVPPVPAAYDTATYYAKFEYNLTSLTIVKDGYAETASIDPNQTFIFRVTGGDLGTNGILVSINGNGSKTISGLTVGVEYTVTELESWSWRYDADSAKTVKLTADPDRNVVTIENSRSHQYWLDGNAESKTNVYGE